MKYENIDDVDSINFFDFLRLSPLERDFIQALIKECYKTLVQLIEKTDWHNVG